MAQEATADEMELAVGIAINELLEPGMPQPAVHKSQMGAIMKSVQTALAKAGKRVDGKVLSEIVRKKM